MWRMLMLWGAVLIVAGGGLGLLRATTPRPYRVLYATPAGLYQVYVDNRDWAVLASHSLIDIQSPVVSPDGRWIAYTRSSACSASIYRLSVDGYSHHLLERFGGDAPCNNGQSAVALRGLQWSPDSAWLLVNFTPLAIVQGLEQRQRVARLYRIPLKGGVMQVLTDETSDALGAAWSDDGRYIAYIQQTPQGRRLIRIQADGSDPVVLTAVSGAYEEPRWSPDGAWVYYRARNGTNWDIYRVSSDGRDNQRLTDNPGFDGMLDWSPHGDWLVLVSDRDGDRDLYIMRPDGSAVQAVTANTIEDARPQWSPSGDWIVFVSYRPTQRGVYVIRPDGRDERHLESTHFSQDWYPTWLPMPELPSHVGYWVGLGVTWLGLGWLMHRFHRKSVIRL